MAELAFKTSCDYMIQGCENFQKYLQEIEDNCSIDELCKEARNVESSFKESFDCLKNEEVRWGEKKRLQLEAKRNMEEEMESLRTHIKQMEQNEKEKSEAKMEAFMRSLKGDKQAADDTNRAAQGAARIAEIQNQGDMANKVFGVASHAPIFGQLVGGFGSHFANLANQSELNHAVFNEGAFAAAMDRSIQRKEMLDAEKAKAEAELEAVQQKISQLEAQVGPQQASIEKTQAELAKMTDLITSLQTAVTKMSTFPVDAKALAETTERQKKYGAFASIKLMLESATNVTSRLQQVVSSIPELQADAELNQKVQSIQQQQSGMESIITSKLAELEDIA